MVKDSQTLVFATDFSERSDAARAWAIKLARQLGLAVVLVHSVEAVDTEDDPGLSRWFSKLKREVAARMEVELQNFHNAGIQAAGDIRVGTPWREILTSGSENRAELIVIGGHSLRSSGVGLIGTTSQKVALAASQPVLIVKGD